MLFNIKFTYFKMSEQIEGRIIIRYLDISFQFREVDGNNVIAFKMNMLKHWVQFFHLELFESCILYLATMLKSFSIQFTMIA